MDAFAELATDQRSAAEIEVLRRYLHIESPNLHRTEQFISAKDHLLGKPRRIAIVGDRIFTGYGAPWMETKSPPGMTCITLEESGHRVTTISDEFVTTCFYYDAIDKLYVGTRTGLHIYDLSNNALYSVPELSNRWIFSIGQGEGCVHALTESGGHEVGPLISRPVSRLRHGMGDRLTASTLTRNGCVYASADYRSPKAVYRTSEEGFVSCNWPFIDYAYGVYAVGADLAVTHTKGVTVIDLDRREPSLGIQSYGLTLTSTAISTEAVRVFFIGGTDYLFLTYQILRPEAMRDRSLAEDLTRAQASETSHPNRRINLLMDGWTLGRDVDAGDSIYDVCVLGSRLFVARSSGIEIIDIDDLVSPLT